MSDLTVASRTRPLWPVFIPPALLILAAAAWSAFWFYSASRVDQQFEQWRAREVASGRVYDCAKRSVAGFPFRLEVTCEGASVTLAAQTAGQTASQTPMTAQLGRILVLSQIYDPKRLIAEFTAPATLAERGQPPAWRFNWRLARSSLVGLSGLPQRIAVVFDEPNAEQLGGTEVAGAKARHVELHLRLAEGSTAQHPVIETALEMAAASVKGAHPLLTEPFDADIRATLRGLPDFAPKPWPQRFRELQAAGGRLEVTKSRIQQGDVIAIAAGSLGLTANGRLDGELQMTITGIEKIVPTLGIEKMLEEGVPQETLDRLAPGVRAKDLNNLIGALDRAIPGLGRAVRQNANAGVAAGINALGSEATLEGRKARTFPLRFVDGEIFFGPLKVGQAPALF